MINKGTVCRSLCLPFFLKCKILSKNVSEDIFCNFERSTVFLLCDLLCVQLTHHLILDVNFLNWTSESTWFSSNILLKCNTVFLPSKCKSLVFCFCKSRFCERFWYCTVHFSWMRLLQLFSVLLTPN